jgi:hypothetical protein
MTDETIPWILSFESGRAWANTLRPMCTKEIYFNKFKRYCDAVHMGPDQLIEYDFGGFLYGFL